MKKILIAVLTLIIFTLIIFYFWASSGFNNPDQYDQPVNYNTNVNLEHDTLSVLTYNIGYFSGMTNNRPVDRKETLFKDNLQKSIGLLRSFDFDFIGLQEVDFNSARSFHYNQFDSLGKYLNFHHGAYAVNWDKLYVPFPYFPFKNHFGSIYSGQGFLSKMQIVSNKLFVLDKPINAPFYYNAFYLDRILQVSKVLIGTDTVVLMNVHLEAFDKDTRELQAEKVLKVFNSYAENFPVILMGDFNSRPPFASEVVEEEKTIKLFLENPLIEEAISRERYVKNEPQFFTFESAKPYERLDYIFYNKNKILKINSDVVRGAKHISDHLPVWMTFTLVD